MTIDAFVLTVLAGILAVLAGLWLDRWVRGMVGPRPVLVMRPAGES